MSGIFGLVRHDGGPVGSTLASLQAAMPEWGRDGLGGWSDDCAALGQARTFSTPESRCEALPVYDREAGLAFTAAGRLDNRQALIAELGLRSRVSAPPGLADGHLMLAAYRRWGDRAPERLFGDWSFAAWHPAQRRLFVARDQLGHTALYYHSDARLFAFSCSERALLALGLTRVELDELYLAQYLVSWPRYHGPRTASSALRRLPPAHTLAVTPERLHVNCYWHMENQPEVRLPSRSDYVVALREVFDAAVRTRLRADRPVGLALSGGLDSGAVAIAAARMLREDGQRLTGFTSVPIGSARDSDRLFGDELPFVRAIAAAAGNIDVVPVSAARSSPIEAIRRALEVFGAPVHAAANMFWMLELHEQAAAAGCRVLLNGSVGNASISWIGDPFSQPLALQLRVVGVKPWLRRRARSALPTAVTLRASERRLKSSWPRSTAIHPEFARRLDLVQRRLADPYLRRQTPLDQRLAVLNPGRSNLGSNVAALGARFGIDIRDPTADIGVLAFTLSVPDAVYRDPDTGLGRWLIREAMRDRLPDQVRLNPRKGLQAADLVTRLRNCAEEVDDALAELQAGPAAEYLAVDTMHAVWRAIKREDTRETYGAAVTILTRGIMAGLYVNAMSQDKVPGAPAGAPSRRARDVASAVGGPPPEVPNSPAAVDRN